MQTLKLSLVMIMAKKKKEVEKEEGKEEDRKRGRRKGKERGKTKGKEGKKKITIMLKQTSAWRRPTRESPRQASCNTGLGPEDNSSILFSVTF